MPTKPPMFKTRFKPAPAPERRGSSTERGYDRDWQKLRDAYLAEHPVCELVDHPHARGQCEQVATQVDHRTPINAGGGRLDWNNLRALCRSCHSRCTANYRDHGVNELPERPLAIGFWD